MKSPNKEKLRAKWRMLCIRLGIHDEMYEMFTTLWDAYHERPYHNMTHIERSLEVFQIVRSRLKNPDHVEYAIWFHDFIYDPMRHDNEMKSAEAAVVFLKNSVKNVDEVITDVFDMILEGRHIFCSSRFLYDPQDKDYFVDIDLSILASAWEDFCEYDDAIRKEYPVDDLVFKQKRGQFLANIASGYVFRTEFFRKNFIMTAYENLEKIRSKYKLTLMEKIKLALT